MYTFSNQTTIECCLSISICFILSFCQSITNQTSITFLFVLNYEFPLVFPFPFVFAIPFIPLPFPFPTIPDPNPFPMIKCGYGNGRGVFPSVSVRFHPYPCWTRPTAASERAPGEGADHTVDAPASSATSPSSSSRRPQRFLRAGVYARADTCISLLFWICHALLPSLDLATGPRS
jgi:hypothetical protein